MLTALFLPEEERQSPITSLDGSYRDPAQSENERACIRSVHDPAIALCLRLPQQCKIRKRKSKKRPKQVTANSNYGDNF